MSKNVLDLDRHIKKLVGPPTYMKIRGEEFELPSDVPMMYLIGIQAARDNSVLLEDETEEEQAYRLNELMQEAYLALMCTCFTKPKVMEWLKNGMDRREFNETVHMLLRHYFPDSYNTDAEEDGGSAPKGLKGGQDG